LPSQEYIYPHENETVYIHEVIIPVDNTPPNNETVPIFIPPVVFNSAGSTNISILPI
jgi:hypothetical protein